MKIYNTTFTLQITSYAKLKNHNNNNYDYKKTSFKGSMHTTQLISTKATKNFEYSLRVLGNKISDLLQPKAEKQLTENIAKNVIPEQTKLYLKQLEEISRLYSTDKIIDVNIEDKILEQIAKKGESTIFIMNHSNQFEDPQMLAVLNTLLSEAYLKTGNEKFPLPKIILNEDILKTMNPTKRKAFENFGAIGIDANVLGSDKTHNARAFFPIVRDFIQNKCNIFIFPEGRLAIRDDLSMFNRFQRGVASLINKIVAIKKDVTVVPIGFSYGGKTKGLNGEILGENGLNGMNIGTPIQIKRIGESTTITCGDILKNKESILFDFFNKHKNETDIKITSAGKPVKPNEIIDYLKTILCENLEINSNLAKEKLKTPLEKNIFNMY